MKNIGNIKTKEDEISALKELTILNTTQYAILTGKIETNREEITKFETEIEEKLNIILKSNELDDEQKIKYMKAKIQSFYNLDDKSLEELKEIYINTMLYDTILSGRLNKTREESEIEYVEENQEIDKEKVYTFEEQTTNNAERLLENEENIDSKKNILRIAIDNVIKMSYSDKDELEYKAKIEEFSKSYFENLTDRLDKINGTNKNEARALELLESLNLKIHESKEEKEEYKYGELSQDKRVWPKLIFRNEDILLKKMESYSTGKTAKNEDNGRIIAKVESKNISKYKLEILEKTGEVVDIDFFATEELENQVQEDNTYLSTILAAIVKAKRENRQYIGELSVIDIDDRFKTSLVQYDEELEEKINEYIKREKIEKEQLKIEIQKTQLVSSKDNSIG